MRIFVDADACPVKNTIVFLAKSYKVPVFMITDTSHQIKDDYSTVITVDKGADAADFKLVNLLQKGDLVVTQDYGLAAMCLAKGATCLNQDGMIYNQNNIDALLFSRHISKKMRNAGEHFKGPQKRTKQQDTAFYNTLLSILKETL